MATARVYSPDTSEPFDVTPSRASFLVLEKGWTRTPWTSEAITPAVAAEDAPRGRGRRRRVTEEAPIEHSHGSDLFETVDETTVDLEDDAESWRD